MRFILTGVSGAGKTTALEALRSRVPPLAPFEFSDIDEGGVPEGVDAAWRKERVREWLARACAAAERGRRSILAGTVLPEDLPPPSPTTPPVRFAVLHAQPDVLTARLHARYRDPEMARGLERATGLSPAAFGEQTVWGQPGFLACFEDCGFETLDVDTTGTSLSHGVPPKVTRWILRQPGWDTFPVLETDRLVLRPLDARDRDGYAELLTDPEEAHFLTDSPVSKDQIDERIARTRVGFETARSIHWVIERQGEFCGYVAIHDPPGRSPALSYAVRRSARRRGVATEAITAVVGYIFRRGALSIRASTHVENDASSALLRSLGFGYGGVAETDVGPRRRFSLPCPRPERT